MHVIHSDVKHRGRHYWNGIEWWNDGSTVGLGRHWGFSLVAGRVGLVVVVAMWGLQLVV